MASSEYDAELRFYGGVGGSIGGNTVVLSIKKGKNSLSYFFDCGVNLQQYSRHKDLGGKLDRLEQYHRWRFFPEFEKTEVRACFISHGHNDHWLAVPALAKSTFSPNVIWSTRTTRQLISRPELLITEKSFSLDPFGYREYYYDDKALQENVKVSVAQFPVDHSVPGACAYIVELENDTLVYTGDFRDHGVLSDKVEMQFWQYVKTRSRNRNTLLITEGTNYGTPYRFNTEDDVKKRLATIFRNYAEELLVLVVNEKDVWRLMMIQDALEHLETSTEISRQVVYAESIGKLVTRIRQTINEDYKRVLDKTTLETYTNWLGVGENQILSEPSIRRVVEKPSRYVVVATRRSGLTICDLLADKMKYKTAGGCCILSLSEIFEEEAGISTREYAKKISELGFSVEEVHSSGHIYPSRLVNIIGHLQPKKVFVMHTVAPQGLKSFIEKRTSIDVIAPDAGTPYPVHE